MALRKESFYIITNNTVMINILENYTPGSHGRNNPFEFNGTYEDFIKIPHHSYVDATVNDPGSFYKKDFIKIKCLNCEKDIINQVASYYSFEDKISKGKADPIQKGFLCKSCKVKRIYQKNYGVDNPQQLDNVKKSNKKSFYENHPNFIPYSEEIINYEGSLKDLMDFPYQWNRKIKFTCSRCKRESVINFGTLRYRYKLWSSAGRNTDNLICKKCAKETAVHPDMIPLLEEPIEWKGSIEELLEKPFYDNQKIKYICEDCGKIVVNSFYSFRRNNKKSFICDRCRMKETSYRLYNAPSYNERNIPEETRNIINNKDNLEKYISEYKEYNTDYIAEKLGLSPITLRRKLENYKISIPTGPRSSAEKEIRDILDSLEIEYIANSKSIIYPYELDIYIPDFKIAIEYNGNYWHRVDALTSRKEFNSIDPRKYHQNKSKICEEKGIRLIHIFEYEWINKKDLVKDYIRNLFSSDNIIQAKDCIIKDVPNSLSIKFEDENNLQGYKDSDVRLGLYYNQELVFEITFLRHSEKSEWEIIRVTKKINTKVNDAFDILFHFFIRNYNPASILAYCDYGKYKGQVFENFGFKLLGLTEPGYLWIKNSEVYEETEEKLMEDKGCFKIYDAGNKIYIWDSGELII